MERLDEAVRKLKLDFAAGCGDAVKIFIEFYEDFRDNPQSNETPSQSGISLSP